jgi:hypothetical protein
MNRHLQGFSSDELETMKSFLRRLLNNGGQALPGATNKTASK